MVQNAVARLVSKSRSMIDLTQKHTLGSICLLEDPGNRLAPTDCIPVRVTRIR